MSVVLYTTHCPKCTVLQKKLDQSNISYEVCDNIDDMIELGYQTAPLLKVEDRIYKFKEAVDWVNKQMEADKQ